MGLYTTSVTRVSFQETDRCRDEVDVEDIDSEDEDDEDSEECELSRLSMVEVGDGNLHLLGVWAANAIILLVRGK